MYKKNPNTPEIPLCINILRLKSYLLPPDELMFFDWLIVKQISFNYKDFFYSQSRIESETRIKRSRQEIIVKKFIEFGIIDSQVRENKETRGRVRYFKVNFDALSDENILCEIISSKEGLFKDFMAFMKYHSSEQKKSLKTVKKDVIDHSVSDRIYKLLNDTYERRRIMYNNGELIEKKPKQKKSATQLQRNKIIDRKLQKLSETYDDNTIKNSFIAYIDAIFKEEADPNNLMSYFLSYKEVSGSFNVFEYYLDYFNLNYSYKD
jgi:hypothetical protein